MYTITQINPQRNQNENVVIENVSVPQRLFKTLDLIDEMRATIPYENFGMKLPKYIAVPVTDPLRLLEMYVQLWTETYNEQLKYWERVNILYYNYLKDFDEFWEDYV